MFYRAFFDFAPTRHILSHTARVFFCHASHENAINTITRPVLNPPHKCARTQFTTPTKQATQARHAFFCSRPFARCFCPACALNLPRTQTIPPNPRHAFFCEFCFFCSLILRGFFKKLIIFCAVIVKNLLLFFAILNSTRVLKIFINFFAVFYTRFYFLKFAFFILNSVRFF